MKKNPLLFMLARALILGLIFAYFALCLIAIFIPVYMVARYNSFLYLFLYPVVIAMTSFGLDVCEWIEDNTSFLNRDRNNSAK